uniref:Tetraspanin n=1 Tax=Neogobius melanostomus TaxID=47308 RepID=A0A8C6SR12_9GOBI
MAVDGCGLVCKYIIILFDCIFAVLGLAFLISGLWLRFSDSTRTIFDIQELNSSTFVIGVTVLIALGAVMLIVVSFGDFGACSENRCSLQVFSTLVTILAAAEILIGVLAYTYRDEVQARVVEFYTSLYTLYVTSGGDPALAVVLTFLHKMFHCCGLSGIPLVELVKQTCPDPDGLWEHIKMANCPSEIASVFDTRASIVLGTFLGTGALLVTALVCSIILLKHLMRSQNDINTYYSKVY